MGRSRSRKGSVNESTGDRWRKAGTGRAGSATGSSEVRKPDLTETASVFGHRPLDAGHVAAQNISYAPLLLRKKSVEKTLSYMEATRTALAATHDGNDSLKLLAVDRSCFFADPNAFQLLKTKIIPDMVAVASRGDTIRIWVPGCRTGEESYSIAMLFLERISALDKNIGLQIFATDIDADAIAYARRGYYPASIERHVPPVLLRRYFKQEGDEFRISPRLRETIVFSTHNLLVNVPFSRLDLIICRNLFRYLPVEEQKKILLLFHFALRSDGILFLGTTKSLIQDNAYFEPVSELSRTSRLSGRRVATGGSANPIDDARPSSRPWPGAALQALLQTYVPASVLVREHDNTLRLFGSVHRYLESPRGNVRYDLIGSARAFLRPAIRKALRQAARGNKASVIATPKPQKTGKIAVTVTAIPLDIDGERFFLVSFLDSPERSRAFYSVSEQLNDALTDLERAILQRREAESELEIVRTELRFTNEEHMVAKEELESTQVELRSLAVQHQATVAEYQKATEDLENILSSSGIPTLFLDENLRVRFLSQTTKRAFRLTGNDIGKQLPDIADKFTNGTALLMKSRQVLSTFVAAEYEVNSSSGNWYSCRVWPYRKKDGQVKGVVIKFFDITALKQAELALNSEKLRAEAASLAKSRFLAAASHDLRQPLQTLRIMQELLLPKTHDDESRELVTSSLNSLTAMSGLLNTLLDINQLEAGVIHPRMTNFSIGQLLERLKAEFTFHASGRGLELRAVPCQLWIHSDPRLLEDMIRNLLSNAVKYTKTGRILFGCRRHADKLSIEVWDTGAGIPEGQLTAIFQEFHQVERNPLDTNRGLGLGLAIVQRLGNLLGHRVSVRSRVGHGSVFSTEVSIAPPEAISGPAKIRASTQKADVRKGKILIIEDEPDVRKSYELLLQSVGHHTIAAADGDEAIARVTGKGNRPDVVIADYSLPGRWDGIHLAARLRQMLGPNLPTVILTGDISIETLRAISREQLIQRSKPVEGNELRDLVQSLLTQQVTTCHPSSQ